MGSALERLASRYGATPAAPGASSMDALAAKYGYPAGEPELPGVRVEASSGTRPPIVTTAPRTPPPEPPGLLARAGQAVGHLVTHPWELATAPAAQAMQMLTVPTTGQRVSDAASGYLANAGIDRPAGSRYATPAHEQTPGDLARASLQTATNLVAPSAFRGASAVLGKVAGAATAGALVGAAQSPDDPMVGALLGGAMGGAGGALGRLAERYSAPRPTVAAEAPAPAAPAPSALDVAAAGGGERFGGVPIATKTMQAARTAYRSALVTPYADIEGEAPGLVAALHRAGAANQRALHIGMRRTAQVTEGLTDEQRGHFGRQLALDNLEAEATRKGAAAADRTAQAAAAPATARPALEAEAAQLQTAADNFRRHADALRPDVPAGLAQEPWFQSALTKHRAYVEAPLTESALAAGVSPDALRSPASAYLRLYSEDRLTDGEIRRAMDATGAAAPGELQPRGPVGRFLLGEKPELSRLFPAGAEGLRQGPLRENAGWPGESRPGAAPRVGVTGSATQAGGTARAYATDYARVVSADARDKALKAARNGVYEQIAQVGRPLAAGEAPTPGKAVLAFDDAKGLVTDEGGTARYEVSQPIAKAVRRFHTELQGQAPTSAGAAWRRFSGGLTRVQLAGMPVEATSHANTLASIVASVPGEADVAGKALATVPAVGAKAAAIREMLGVDFAHPATRTLENRLADIGALRVEAPHGGLLNTAHHWLFGPEGVDVRGRLVLARKYLDRAPDATDDALREFITSKLGNYVRGNAGALVNGLQDSGVSSFARFQAARIPASVRATFGASGLPATGAAQRVGDVANTLWRGPLGYAVGAGLANTVMSGHGTAQNERGHGLDVQVGWGGKSTYLVDGKLVRLPDAEAQALGDRARPLFVPGATLNPVVATGLRASGARDLIPGLATRDGAGRVADVVRDLANTGLGTLSPALRALSVAVTGRAPYLNTDGTLLKQVPSRFNKDVEAVDRVKAAVAAANPATHAFLGEGGDAGGRSLGGALGRDGQLFGGPAAVAAKTAEFLMPRILAPGVGGVQNDVSAMARDEREYTDALADYKAQLRRAVGPEQVGRIIDEAKHDAQRAGVNPMSVEQALLRFSNTPEVATAARREAQLRRSTARHRTTAP